MAAKLRKDETASVSFRIDKSLKKSLKKKYGRKLSDKVVPYLKQLCG